MLSPTPIAFLFGGLVYVTCLAALAQPLDVPAVHGSDVIAKIDAQVSAIWSEYEIKPSPEATDSEWCRRVHLDLLGRIPTLDELRDYVADRSPLKKQQLVERLLSDGPYRAEYARHWSEVWANLLVGRTGGTERNSLISRDGLERYLFATLLANRPYDEFVNELLVATGTNAPGSEQFNGAVNFLTAKLADSATQATARTARLFLGRQVQCTQCHNHPSNDWQQSQFWELNAFFRQAVPLRRFEAGTRNIRTVELTDQDFAGEGTTPDEAEVYFEQRNGLLKAAYPTFIDGQEIASRSGYLEDVNRRAQLARFVCHSPMLAEAIVNRMWGRFLGYGFTSPVDDIGPHNPPSHPELFALLAESFRAHDHDLKWLIRQIALSRPYGLSSRMNKTNQTDDPELGEPPKFSRFYLRQMTPEQLYDSLAMLAGKSPPIVARFGAEGSKPEQMATAEMMREQVASSPIVSQQKRRWLQQFARALGNDEAGETSTFNGTIPQTLTLFNGQLVRDACSFQSGTLPADLTNSPAALPERLQRLSLAVVARKPKSKELKLARQLMMVRAQPGDTQGGSRPASRSRRASASRTQQGAADEALRDMMWALLNSNEFILNH